MTFFKKLFSQFNSADISMAGTWEGYYGYSKQYPERYHNRQVKFVADISGDGTEYFTGSIKESEDGIPEIAPIEGRLKGAFLRFMKTYQKRYVAGEEGILEAGGTPQIIQYEGFYDSSKQVFSGEWKIEGLYLHEGRRIRHVSKGPFEMRRKSSQ